MFTYNGGEFIKLRSYLTNNGISHVTTPPHTPEQNGLIERKHRHLVETARCLLHHAHVPKHFWCFALQTATYLINRLPTLTLRNNNPFTTLFNPTPNYQKLRIFGCLCFPWLKPHTNHKLQPRSTPYVFLGYSPNQSAYICLDPQTLKFYHSGMFSSLKTLTLTNNHLPCLPLPLHPLHPSLHPLPLMNSFLFGPSPNLLPSQTQ